jgi:hypothetical protein
MQTPGVVVERSWLETIQSLGLDVQVGIILLMIALDGAGTLVRRIAARLATQPRRRRNGRTRVAPADPADASAWPPGPWRPNDGPAG